MKKTGLFFTLTLISLVFGLLMIGDVSLLEAANNFGDKYYFIKHQLFWMGIGFILMISCFLL